MEEYQQYHWVGVNRAQQTIRGNLNAKTETLAKVYLHQQGIIVKKITLKQSKLRQVWQSRITERHITHFTQQLLNLLEAHMPLVSALLLLQQSETHPRFKKLIYTLQTDTQSGMPFSRALQKHPKYFDTLFCHVVHAGERSGTLVQLLSALKTQRDTQATLKKKLKSSLTYPLLILSLAFIITIGLLRFVVPQFEALFTSFNTTLPGPTLCLIHLSCGLKQYGLGLFIASTTLVLTLRHLYQTSHQVRFLWDKTLILTPFIRTVIQHAVLARLTHALATLLAGSLPLVEAIQVASHLTHNLYYKEALNAVHTSVLEGRPLRRALQDTACFPQLVTELIGMGETTGQLQEVLAYIAKQQQEALTYQLETLSSLFEPILMALLGLWIGALIIALYLPIFHIGAILT